MLQREVNNRSSELMWTPLLQVSLFRDFAAQAIVSRIYIILL
jgi:hypothetical protein